MRQVVVTGLGAITPLGLGSLRSFYLGVPLTTIGARRSWKQLLNGACGIRSLDERGASFEKLLCRVGGLVPEGSREAGGWKASEWLSRDVLVQNRSLGVSH